MRSRLTTIAAITATAAFAAIAAFAAVAISVRAAAAETASPDSTITELRLRSDSLWNAGQRDTAAALSLRALDLARAEADTLAVIDLLIRAGQHARFFGRSVEAEAGLREARALAAARGDTARLLASTRWLSVAVGLQGRAAEARALAEELLRLSEAAGDPAHQGWARVGLAWDALRNGRSDEALRLYREATPRFEQVQEIEGLLWSLLGLGRAASATGDYAVAADAYRRTIEEARARGEPISEGIALNDLGCLEYYLGDPMAARELFRSSGELHRRLGSWHETVLPQVNLALCDREMGRESAAEETLQAALATCRRLQYRDLETVVRSDLAKLSAERGRKRESAERYRTLLAEDGLTLRNRVESLCSLAEVMAASDSQAAALELLTQAQALLQERHEADLQPLVLLGLGLMLNSLDRPQEAEARLREAVEAAARVDQHQEEIEAWIEIARIRREHAQPDSAHAALARAAEIWENDRDRALDPSWREAQWRLGPALYTTLLDVTLDGRIPSGASFEQAFDRVQPFKSRTLLERMIGPGAPLERRVAAERGIHATLARLRAQVLGPDELFLDYYLGPKGSFLFAVTAESSRVVRLPAEKELAPLLRFHHQLCARPPTAGERATVPSPDPPAGPGGAQLARTLFGEIEGWIARSRTVYVAPDGPLNLVSGAELWHELRTADGRSAAGREPTWVRVPSATVLSQLRERAPLTPDPALRILAVAGQAERGLAGSRWEVHELGRRFDGVTVRAGTSGGDSLLRRLSCHDVLHFAAHLQLDQQSPWQSELQFASPGAPENLRAAEIAASALPARLVVLSSCASAHGRVLSGEGVLGITSAFLSAGAPAVVATLWPVDDRTTAQAMVQLYDALADGATVAEAVARTQAAIRGAPETAHPFYWAGLVVVGDGETRVPVRRREVWPRYLPLAAAIGLAVAGGAVELRSRRRRAAHL